METGMNMDALLSVVLEGMTMVDENDPSQGLTYCDDLSPEDVLVTLGYVPPFVELVERKSRALHPGPNPSTPKPLSAGGGQA